MEKFQSVEEVNALIPELQKVFGRLAELNELSFSLTRDIQSLFEIWGESLRDGKNPDHEFAAQKEARKDEANRMMQEEIEKIHELGGVVKDIQKGLVDFYIEHEGEGIYLCWKAGDDKIRYWHPLQGGFAARRPLTELFEARYI